MQKNTKLFLCVSVLIFLTTNLRAQTDANIPIKGICIYIDYPDAPPTVTPQLLDSMINETDFQALPTVNRSVRNYFYQETRRNYDLTHDIFYYTAPLPSTYYDTVHWSAGILLWRDALEDVITNNPTYNWSQLSRWTNTDLYDKEGPGYMVNSVKAVMIISSKYGPAGLGGTHTPQWTLSNGTFIGKVQGSTLQRPWDNGLNLFTACHEHFHSIFNIPDTYDRDASSGGTGKYTVMSSQGPDIEPVGAPFLIQHNWAYIKEPSVGTQTYILPADGDTVIRITNPHDPNEFFALEARKNTTLGNSLFPAPLGLLVWHVDRKVYSGNDLENRTRYEHYTYAVVQKDGLFELETGGPNQVYNIGDIYLPGDSLTDNSTPNAKWWASENSGIKIKDIQLLGSNAVQVTVELAQQHTDHYAFIPKTNWTIVSETPAQDGFDASMVLDNDTTTYYHMAWNSTMPHPHEIVIDMAMQYNVNEFYCQANNNYSPPWEGRIKDYELSFSTDGINWGAPVASEQLFRSPYRQYELFPSQIARYVKFVALNSHDNDNRTSIAEINLRGALSNLSIVESLSEKFIIYPNPTERYVFVEGLIGSNKLTLYAASGVAYKSLNTNSNSARVDLIGLASGLYFLTIYDNDGIPLATKRIVKQ